MTRLCSTDKLTCLLSLLLHDLLLLCSFLLHHPLVLVYFVLLSPYVLNLLLFLHPLVFSTSLFILVLLTVSPHLHGSQSRSPEFPGRVCSAVSNILRVELITGETIASLTEQFCLDMEDHFNQMVPNEACFFYNSDNPIEKLESSSQNDVKAENLSEENACSQRRTAEEEERTAKTIFSCRKVHSRRPSEILRRDGSARKEKEWKRTLACKLFEERMTSKLFEDRTVVDGDEEMDLLWEAYEVDARKAERSRRKPRGEKRTAKEQEKNNDYDDEGMPGRPCCLKALRFSAGKMSLGVGRPSLVKVSMALKGMALFHSAGRSGRECR